MASYATTIAVAPLLCLCAMMLLFGEGAVAEEYLERTVYAKSGVMNHNEVVPVDAKPPTRFGQIHMRDRPILDNDGNNANTVGRVRDALSKVVDGTDYTFYSYMVFQFKDDSRFNGSTLEVGGLYGGGDAELAIFGGTGNLTMARGVVRRRKLFSIPGSGYMEELKIYAYYTPLPRMEAYGNTGSGHEIA